MRRAPTAILLAVTLAVASAGAGAGCTSRPPPVEPGREEAGPMKVLFVGNSYTFYNDLPGTLLGMAKARGQALEVAQLAEPGATLEQHLAAGEVTRRLQAQRFTWVVLQEQSQRPFVEPEGFKAPARQLDARIRASGARTLLYLTWPRQDAPPADRAGLEQAYVTLAEELSATIAPVGPAWIAALAAQPGAPLYDVDGAHPAPAGTYLAAAVFYARLFPDAAAPPTALGLEESLATRLRAVAADTVQRRQGR